MSAGKGIGDKGLIVGSLSVVKTIVKKKTGVRMIVGRTNADMANGGKDE